MNKTSEDAQPMQAPIPYVLEDQVGHLLRRANQRHTALFAELMGEDGLTPMQFAALVRLAADGPLSQNHLGRLTAMDPATIQGVIRRLAERALILRVPDPDDRRRMVLTVSPQGNRLVDGVIATARAITEATLAPLTAEEKTTFIALLRKLI